MLDKLFDGYVWKARILVAAVVLLPVFVILPWFTATVGIHGNPWLRNAIVMAGLTALGSMVVRQLGLNAERGLKAEWGGFPTTIIMRWSDFRRSAEWKGRAHALAHDKLGVQLLTAEAEAEDPAEANRRITEAFDKIRTVIWGKKDLASHAANVDYGFARNLYGCRWLWFLSAVASTCTTLLLPAFIHAAVPVPELCITFMMTAAIPLLVRSVIHPQATHCAFRYAEHAWGYLERM